MKILFSTLFKYSSKAIQNACVEFSTSINNLICVFLLFSSFSVYEHKSFQFVCFAPVSLFYVICLTRCAKHIHTHMLYVFYLHPHANAKKKNLMSTYNLVKKNFYTTALWKLENKNMENATT